MRATLPRLWNTILTAAAALLLPQAPSYAGTVRYVPTQYPTIQAAINASAPADTVRVAAGTYSEHLVLNKILYLYGARQGVDARSRFGPETIVTSASGRLLEMHSASGSFIDGFTFQGGTTSIEVTGPQHSQSGFQNNRFQGFTDHAVLYSAPTDYCVLSRCLVEGSSKQGGGGLVQLGDFFHGHFLFQDNDVVNGQTAAGLFSDGNRNVGVSPVDHQTSKISGCLFAGNATGVDMGSRSYRQVEIYDNVFRDNLYSGLAGGPLECLIHSNAFRRNARGLWLTGYGVPNDPTRGAKDNQVYWNTFAHNTTDGIFLDSDHPDTIASNLVEGNNLWGNGLGLH
jgi:hypothetical protein